MKYSLLLSAVVLLTAGAAHGQSVEPRPDRPRFHGTVSLGNLFDGNINHDRTPVRSYGIVPSGAIVFESSREPALVWAYELAANSFTGTDQWDRMSHSMYSVWSSRLGRRIRLESGATASWKGSSEDRELANEFGVSQRVAYKLLSSTRLVVTGSYRYKQYPDDPDTSGPSPYVAAKVDQRLAEDRKLTFGYKYQRRFSHAQRDRYRRSAFSVAYSTSVFRAAERLSIELEYRPQQYERLIRVLDRREFRMDRRFIADVAYERTINHRTTVQWITGFERRTSNDPNKQFIAPSFGVTISYRVR